MARCWSWCAGPTSTHTGTAGWYHERHGNLRTDGAQAVLGRALERGGRSIDAVWFGPDRLPAVEELAARYGDRTGLGLHFHRNVGPLPVVGPGVCGEPEALSPSPARRGVGGTPGERLAVVSGDLR